MNKKNTILIRIIIYITILLLPIGMFAGSVHGIKELNNYQVETIVFDSIRLVNDDSQYYIIKDVNARTFEIESHYQSGFRFNQFEENIEVGDELVITYVGEKTLIGIKDNVFTYLTINDSMRLLRQSYTVFIIISVVLFWGIVFTEIYEFQKWMNSDDFQNLE